MVLGFLGNLLRRRMIWRLLMRRYHCQVLIHIPIDTLLGCPQPLPSKMQPHSGVRSLWFNEWLYFQSAANQLELMHLRLSLKLPWRCHLTRPCRPLGSPGLPYFPLGRAKHSHFLLEELVLRGQLRPPRVLEVWLSSFEREGKVCLGCCCVCCKLHWRCLIKLIIIR